MKLKFALIAITIFSIVSIKTFAYTKNNKEEPPIITFENVSTCKVYLNIPFSSLDIYNNLDTNDQNYKDIAYQDNAPVNLGIDFSYKNYGFAYSKKILNTNNEKKCGKTEASDFLVYNYERNYGIDLIYQYRQGMFLIEPEKFGYKEGDPETIRPDIKKRALTFNFFYATSDDYSFKAAFKQLEKQNKWAWSPMVMFSLNYFKISSDYSMIPPVADTSQFFDDDIGYRGGEYYSASLMPGVGITIPFYNFHYAIAGFFGIGITKCNEKMALKKEKKTLSAFLVNLRSSIGYNGDTYFWGITQNIHSVMTDKSESESSSDYYESEPDLIVSSDTYYIEIFIGYRI